ncbi:hypothetical protein [Priestia megaterium]|uniref:hypothetical protein n=1 Tax=Priestia megaterium TaxID=1404 RepID=UPI0013E29528|nr:hypothetical protein [Priestia megaterium]MED3865200.1 hypothetical protein [Priestia megaterium]MED4100549.1 hypothetical protein [Priestia megaterium]MED4144400.1 hypothetical protein [Priestia megaterium]MED4165699.1 hypothetical protein [Priestia megaterium]MED4198155.1 hypothetical protein [Priestia megaterium]
MKKRIKPLPAIIVGAAISIGGIWLINESRYPNVSAFDDHFTREFLNKDKKVDDGFYKFKSKTSQYTMLFPEEYQIVHENNEDYVVSGKMYERWVAAYTKEHKKDHQINSISLKFSEGRDPEDESFSVKSLMKNRFNASEPKVIETSNTRIYYQSAYIYFKEPEKHVINDSKEHVPNTYVAYVVDKNSTKVIQLSIDEVGGFIEDNDLQKNTWV